MGQAEGISVQPRPWLILRKEREPTEGPLGIDPVGLTLFLGNRLGSFALLRYAAALASLTALADVG
jgi:hypothetical protein